MNDWSKSGICDIDSLSAAKTRLVKWNRYIKQLIGTEIDYTMQDGFVNASQDNTVIEICHAKSNASSELHWTLFYYFNIGLHLSLEYPKSPP